VARLRLPPGAHPPAVDRPQRLAVVEADARQLALVPEPPPAELEVDHARELRAATPPFLPDESRMAARPQYPATIVGKRAAQRDWWPVSDPTVPAGWAIDPNPKDKDREKPRSLGLDEMSVNEAANALESELRHLPVVNEIPDRADCRGGPRPCPLVSCPSNNYLSRTSSGAAKLTWPNLEPWEVPPKLSCAEDMIERGPVLVKTIAKALNMTDERVRQVYVDGIEKLRNHQNREELRDALVYMMNVRARLSGDRKRGTDADVEHDGGRDDREPTKEWWLEAAERAAGR
jgi:hypothetical protein